MNKPSEDDLSTVEQDMNGAPERPASQGGGGVSRRGFVAGLGAAAAVAAVGTTSTSARASGAASVYRIHPAIGVARLGNLDPSAGFVVGPEIPGHGPTDGLGGAPVTAHKVGGLVKPQAARFRVWEYAVGADGRLTPVGEVVPEAPTPGQPFVKAITWTVHLANKKASFYEEAGPTGETLPAGALRNPTIQNRASLESDFGPRTISGVSAGPQPFTPATAGGYPARVVHATDGSVVIDYLGQLRTDASGRLLVLGGKGHSASSLSPAQPLTHWSNNNYWFDDISDGPVTATVTIDDGFGHLTEVPMDAASEAWVLVAPPDFSPGIHNYASLYDVLYDMAVRKMEIPIDNTLYDAGGPLARLATLNAAWNTWEQNPTPGGFEFGSFMPDYQTEIWPIVLNAVNYVYTTGLVNFKHGNMLTDPLGDPSPDAAKDRQVFFGFVRPPENAATNVNGPATMPRLYGDNWYVGNENFHYTFGQNGNGNAGGGAVQGQGPRAVPQWQRYATMTPTQFGLLRAWCAGNFIPPPGPFAPDSTITPHGLDRAALEGTIGGPFYPGIECSWQIRNPALFMEPFRLNPAAKSQYLRPDGTPELTPIGPGHFSRQMALPWQADFNDCSKLLNLGVWPSARADDVFLHVNDKLTDRVPWARPDNKFASGGTSANYEDMVANWYKFGFLVDAGGGFYIESERNPHIP
ncbi:MAG: LodA/GoxA family CTQ-dependent oxidase [Byssovorax sp.]